MIYGFIKNKILSYYHEAIKIKKGEFPFPRMALIYPSYACNHHCPGCHYKDWNRERSLSPYMDFEKFKNLLTELKSIGVLAIEFCGGGEPTCHPRFNEMVELISDYGFKFGLFTHGGNLDLERQELLVKNTSYIRVSIDQECDWYNLKRFVDTRNQLGSKTTIGAKILVSQLNLNKIEERIVRCLNECKVDYAQLKPEKPSPNELTEEQRAALRSTIRKFQICEAPVIGDLVSTTLKGRCWLSPIHTMIDAYGDVYICCYYQFREESHKIGNVFQRKFIDLWGAEKHRQVISQIKNEECNVFDCRWHRYNDEMEYFLKNNHLEFC